MILRFRVRLVVNLSMLDSIYTTSTIVDKLNTYIVTESNKTSIVMYLFITLGICL